MSLEENYYVTKNNWGVDTKVYFHQKVKEAVLGYTEYIELTEEMDYSHSIRVSEIEEYLQKKWDVEDWREIDYDFIFGEFKDDINSTKE